MAIGLADDAVLVHHQHPVLHVLDHQLVHLRHVGKIDFTLRRDGFDHHCALGKRMRKPAGGEEADA